jgi:hypothetical protein
MTASSAMIRQLEPMSDSAMTYSSQTLLSSQISSLSMSSSSEISTLPVTVTGNNIRKSMRLANTIILEHATWEQTCANTNIPAQAVER